MKIWIHGDSKVKEAYENMKDNKLNQQGNINRQIPKKAQLSDNHVNNPDEDEFDKELRENNM